MMIIDASDDGLSLVQHLSLSEVTYSVEFQVSIDLRAWEHFLEVVYLSWARILLVQVELLS